MRPPVQPPPLIAKLMLDADEVRRKWCPQAKLAWKQNAAGDYVVAIIVPKDATTMVR